MPLDIVGLAIGAIIEVGADPVLARLGRSERLIRALRKPGIEHLTDNVDFDTVYAYTLVHYGIDKPSQALEIFQDDWVRNSFRAWFYHDDSQGLKAEIDNIIERNLEAGNARYARIDARAELDEFTNTFRGIVHDSRTPAEADDHDLIRELRDIVVTQAQLEEFGKSLLVDMGRVIEEKTSSPLGKGLLPPSEGTGKEQPSSSTLEDTDNLGDRLESLIRFGIHSLAYENTQEERLYHYSVQAPNINIFMSVTFSILDRVEVPIQVKYGILRKLDYDSVGEQARSIVVASFDSDHAAAKVEEVLLSTIDIEAIVLELETFIATRRAESSEEVNIADLRGEIEELLVPYVNEDELRPLIEHAFSTGLPDPIILGRRIFEVCAGEVIASVEAL